MPDNKQTVTKVNQSRDVDISIYTLYECLYGYVEASTLRYNKSHFAFYIQFIMSHSVSPIGFNNVPYFKTSFWCKCLFLYSVAFPDNKLWPKQSADTDINIYTSYECLYEYCEVNPVTYNKSCFALYIQAIMFHPVSPVSGIMVHIWKMLAMQMSIFTFCCFSWQQTTVAKVKQSTAPDRNIYTLYECLCECCEVSRVSYNKSYIA